MYKQDKNKNCLLYLLTIGFILSIFSIQKAYALGGSRSCEATGSMTFTFREYRKGHLTHQSIVKVGILKSDMHTATSCKSNKLIWRTAAKKCACSRAASGFLFLAGYGATFDVSNLTKIHRPPNMDQ